MHRRNSRSKPSYVAEKNRIHGERMTRTRLTPGEEQCGTFDGFPKQRQEVRKKLHHKVEDDDYIGLPSDGLIEDGLNIVQQDYEEGLMGDLSQCSKSINRTVSETDNEHRGKSRAYNIALMLLEVYDFVVMKNQLHVYNEAEGFWKLIQESEANRYIRSIIPVELCGSINKNALYEIYEWLIVNAPKKEQNTEIKRKVINFRDVALDWSSGGLIKDRKDYLFSYALNLNYKASNDNNNNYFLDFVHDVFAEDIDTLREFKKFLGLCLSDIRWLKVCFFLYGPSNTGKSVLLNVLKRIIGDEWSSSVSFTQMANEFAVTQLLGKRINLSPEVSGASNRRLDIFKSLTGNDAVTACFKGKDHFQFVNEALLVFACNNFPPIQAIDEFDSFLSRIIIFPFKNVISRQNWIDNLDEKIVEDKDEIINFAVEGLVLLQEDEFCFRESEAMIECKQEFVGLYNSFSIFADLYLEEDCNATILSKEIRDKYINFCMSENYMSLADNVWPQVLKQKYHCKQKTISVNEMGMTKRVRGYQGVRFKNDNDMIISPIYRNNDLWKESNYDE